MRPWDQSWSYPAPRSQQKYAKKISTGQPTWPYKPWKSIVIGGFHKLKFRSRRRHELVQAARGSAVACNSDRPGPQ
eukprot:6446660-Amphidinium_carterae.1